MPENWYTMNKERNARLAEIKRLNNEIQYLRQLIREKNMRNTELMAGLKAVKVIGKSGLKTKTYQHNG